MARRKPVREGSDLQERVVFIHRVSKVVKGGRRFSLAALVVVGDGNGKVGLGYGKSAEVPGAISKAKEAAKKNMFYVPVTADGSIPHQTTGQYGAGRVLLQPAVEGTGVIAGGPVRPLFELAGIKNILSKSLGTNNAMNVIKAAAVGLQQLESPKQTAERRGMTVAKMFGIKESHYDKEDKEAKNGKEGREAKGAKAAEESKEGKEGSADKIKKAASDKSNKAASEKKPSAKNTTKSASKSPAKKPGVKANAAAKKGGLNAKAETKTATKAPKAHAKDGAAKNAKNSAKEAK